jgi:hypothetical protein
MAYIQSPDQQELVFVGVGKVHKKLLACWTSARSGIADVELFTNAIIRAGQDISLC